MSGVTVGVDARAAAEVPAGRGRYVRELLHALAAAGGDERYILYCREPASLKLDHRFRWERIGLPDPLWHVAAARRATRSCDVFWSTNSYLTAWFTGIPTAVVVYDLVPFIADAPSQRRAHRIERATIGIGVRRARCLVCISHATRDDLVDRYPSTAGRTVVVHLGADAHFASSPTAGEIDAVRARHGLQRPFVLSAGTLEPRKNLIRLVEAFAALSDEERAGHELAIVGPEGWEAGELLQRVEGAAHVVRRLGFVTDDDLAALYHACTAFAFPSLYEGFGLPVLEAMQSGAPVITSGLSSLPEVAGVAAEYIDDPRDVPAIARSLTTVIGSAERREAMRAAGLRQAASFSWERAAQQMREIFGAMEQAADSRGRPGAARL